MSALAQGRGIRIWLEAQKVTDKRFAGWRGGNLVTIATLTNIGMFLYVSLEVSLCFFMI